MLGSILIRLAAIAALFFAFLVLVGLWDDYERGATALGFSSPFESYLAAQAGFPHDPHGYRWATTVAELEE